MVALEKAKAALGDGKALRELDWTEDELKELKQLQFLTMKPMLYVVNVDEGQMTNGSWKSKLPNLVQRTDIRVVPVCVKMEAELASMSDEEKKEYMETMGLTESGLDQLIKVAYDVLGLYTFLTTGEVETRAWTVLKGAKAPQAAGVIHSDFEKTFIRAEVISAEDLIREGSEAACRDKGLLRIEGKDYVMKDGDVCHFRVGA
jgi:GTP-binding protein YchF